MSRIFAHSQTRSLKSSSKCRSTVIMASGRSRMVLPFLVVGSEPSVPCRLCFVYRMDKVELRSCLKRVAVRSTGKVHLGYEHTNIPDRSDRPPVELYQRFDPCRESGWSAAQPGHAPSH